jgi:hypothetical protein
MKQCMCLELCYRLSFHRALSLSSFYSHLRVLPLLKSGSYNFDNAKAGYAGITSLVLQFSGPTKTCSWPWVSIFDLQADQRACKGWPVRHESDLFQTHRDFLGALEDDCLTKLALLGLRQSCFRRMVIV